MGLTLRPSPPEEPLGIGSASLERCAYLSHAIPIEPVAASSSLLSSLFVECLLMLLCALLPLSKYYLHLVESLWSTFAPCASNGRRAAAHTWLNTVHAILSSSTPMNPLQVLSKMKADNVYFGGVGKRCCKTFAFILAIALLSLMHIVRRALRTFFDFVTP